MQSFNRSLENNFEGWNCHLAGKELSDDLKALSPSP